MINILNEKIPSKLNPRNNKILVNNYYINNKNIDINVIIYFIHSNKLQIILRNMENENGWNEDVQIIIQDMD